MSMYLLTLFFKKKEVCNKCKGTGKIDIPIIRIGKEIQIEVINCSCLKK